MEYLTLMVLIHDGIILILSILCLKISINVLLNKNLIKKCFNFSPTIAIYLIYLFLWSFTSFLSCLYLIIFWRPEINIYETKILYLFSLPQGILMMLNPAMEFTLCADRCLSILFPLKYSQREKNLYSIFALGIIIFSMGSIIWINKLIFILFEISTSTTTTTNANHCRFFGCILATYVNIFPTKICLTAINVFGGVVLFILIKFILNSDNAETKKINKTVLIIIASTTFFELLPNVMAEIFQLFTAKPLAQYIGSTALTLGAINITICAQLYCKAFKKVFNSTVSSKVMLVVNYITK